jgi:hypothetical protein
MIPNFSGDCKSNGGPEPVAVAPNRTDRGNAVRLVDREGKDLRHSEPWRKWLVWDGRRWREDDTGGIVCRAKQMLVDLFQGGVSMIQDIHTSMKEKAR